MKPFSYRNLYMTLCVLGLDKSRGQACPKNYLMDPKTKYLKVFKTGVR